MWDLETIVIENAGDGAGCVLRGIDSLCRTVHEGPPLFPIETRSLSKRYAASYREVNDPEWVTLPVLTLTEQKAAFPLKAWPAIFAIAQTLPRMRVFISSPANLELASND
jgi:hypothetical protein